MAEDTWMLRESTVILARIIDRRELMRGQTLIATAPVGGLDEGIFHGFV